MQLTPPLGLLYSNTVNESWAFGAGYFVSGGSKVDYTNVDFGGTFGSEPDIKTDLTVTEASIGAAYKVNEALKLGVGLRLVMATGEFAFAQRAAAGAVLTNVKLTGLKDNDNLAFRLGAQYKLSEATTIGANYRSPVSLDVSGKIAGQNSGGSTATIAEGDVIASTKFPQQLSIGAQHVLSETWVGLFEYSWTQYSVVDRINLDTSNSAIADTFLTQNWKDQHNVRLGAENTSYAMPIRFGYGFTSQVTDKDFARASFTAPGPGHTVTLGSGNKVDLEGQTLGFDYGYEYTIVTGNGNGATAGTATGDIREGTHTTTAHAIHLAATYKF